MKRLITVKRANSIIDGFSKARVLVLGDLIMDHFIWGKVRRISPEAPVPVVDVTRETVLLGGSANVVNNIQSLGGRSLVSGVVGRDGDGRRLVKMLEDKAIKTSGIVVDPKRPTTVKTRVIAHSQQVVRFDRESRLKVGPSVISGVYGYVKKALRTASLVLISDYGKGLVSKEFVETVMALAIRAGKPVVVDPKGENFDYYTGATLVTPNNVEASLASGIEIEDEQGLKRAGEILLNKLGSEALLITRGEHGMSLFLAGSDNYINIPTVAREVYDVSGAGDTVVSVLALALASGAGFKEAAVLANLAAGVVVGKVGTATLTPIELREALNRSLKAKVRPL